MTNKEVIDKLQKSFLEEEPEEVARLAANFLVDINNFYSVDQLSEDDRKEFMRRITFNVRQLCRFMKDESLMGLYIITHDDDKNGFEEFRE